MEITITEYHADSSNADFEPTLFVGFIADLWGHDDDDDDLSLTNYHSEARVSE